MKYCSNFYLYSDNLPKKQLTNTNIDSYLPIEEIIIQLRMKFDFLNKHRYL